MGAPTAAGAGRGFRLRRWPTVFVAVVLPVLLGLGAWQLDRREWKTDLLGHIAERMAAPAIALPASIDDADAWDYRRVTVTGTFMHDDEMVLTGRTHRGRAGVHLVTPLRRSDPHAAGEIVLVNRGWVPAERRAPASRPDSLVAGEVQVEGIAKVPPPRGWMQPDNEPHENLWFWTDLPAMAAYARIPDVAPVVIEVGGAAAPGTLPVGGGTTIDIPNNHLQYAFTWFSLAAALVAIYILYHLREAGRGPERGRSGEV